MDMRAFIALAASAGLLVNCTPYQPIDRDDAPGDVSVPMIAETQQTATTTQDETLQDGAADGGAGEIDSAVSAVYKIRTRADVATSATAMMTLADKDTDGQLTLEEFGVISPALAQADNSITSSVDGGPVANPGAGENMEGSTADPIRRNDFFSETAGSDNLISHDELEAALTSRFTSADADGNGELTSNETSDFAASMMFSKE